MYVNILNKEGIKMTNIKKDCGKEIKSFKFDGSHSKQGAMVSGCFIIYPKIPTEIITTPVPLP